MNDEWYAKTDEAISSLKQDHVLLKADLTKNTEATMRIESNTQGVVDAFGAAKGAFQTLETIGKIAKPVLWTVGVISGTSAVWFNFKHHIAELFK